MLQLLWMVLIQLQLVKTAVDASIHEGLFASTFVSKSICVESINVHLHRVMRGLDFRTLLEGANGWHGSFSRCVEISNGARACLAVDFWTTGDKLSHRLHSFKN